MGGLSGAEFYQHAKTFLLLPNVDMRTRAWREFFEKHPPGRGVYRSAYKNVQRVLRTEANRAYRAGIQAYAGRVTWAGGIKWNLSAAHKDRDICDWLASADNGLGAGVYEVGNAPDSGHPHCLCYLTIIPKPEVLAIAA